MFCASFFTEKLDFGLNRTCYLNMYLFLSIFSSPSQEKKNILEKDKPLKRMEFTQEFSCNFWENPFAKSHTACSWVSRL